ncbi:MAG: class I SAM-dependent methyltransferase [Pseudomonadota bacterium]
MASTDSEMTPDDKRKALEAEFHNKREKDRLNLSEEEFLKKYPNKKIYAIDRGSKDFLWDWLARETPGKRVLDYCCGLGKTSIQLAEMGAHAYGIDISADEVATAAKTAEEKGLADNTEFKVMDAENMEFPDDSFDVIVCIGVLHHLELAKAYPELARVLKPDGKIIAAEALGYNPFIQLYRRMTPHLRTAWETDHILTLRQVDQGALFFNETKVEFFHLFTILAIPFQRFSFFKKILRAMEIVDSLVLKIPLLRRMAWQMVFIYSKPK